MKLLNRKTTETFKYKYIVQVNNKNFEILSNFNMEKFEEVIEEIEEQWEEVEYILIKECIDFEYTDENEGITLDVLRNYL